jgi:integrase
MKPEPPETPKGDWIYTGENLRRRKASGTYYAFAKVGGKQKSQSLKTTDKDLAKRRLKVWLAEMALLAPAEAARITFAELAARWIDAERHTLKESSAKRRADAAKAIAPAFSGLQIRNITAGHCEEWAKRRAADSAAATFVKELDTMRGAFRYAVAHGLILRDPSANVKRQRIRNKRPFVPTRELFAAIVAAIRADEQAKGSDGADMVELLAFSGMRLGEARELRWRDVNFAQGVFTVTGGERGTKNHEQRTVPLSDSLRALLERIKRERGSVAPVDCILRTASARKCLDTACRKLGLQECTHHALRHYFATVCVVDNGIPIPTVAAWLGHKDGDALLMKRYAHVLQAESKSQMKRVSFHAAPVPPGVATPMDAKHYTGVNLDEPAFKSWGPPSPLGNPAPAPTAEGEDSGAGTPTP